MAGASHGVVSGLLSYRLQLARRNPSSVEAVLLRNGRYKEQLDFEGDLWDGEQTGKLLSCDHHPLSTPCVVFDWYGKSVVSAPGWADDCDPMDVKLKGSYVPYTDHESKIESRIEELNLNIYRVEKDSEGYPLSPTPFRIGIRGRGVLGKWGPNHAGDAIVTRVNPTNGKLQVLLIQRTDGSEQFAFPGGFVDPGEFTAPVQTIIRELIEETIGVEKIKRCREDITETVTKLKKIFGEFEWDAVQQKVVVARENVKWGSLVSAGYVKDERNTDNAWMETLALHWHISGDDAEGLKFDASDDARPGSAAFYDIVGDSKLAAEGCDPLTNLFASHSEILKTFLEKNAELGRMV